MTKLRGKWRITVTGREAAWDQRVCINGSDNADGNYLGKVGTSFEVDGETPWTLTIEHNDGSGWSPSSLRLSSKTVVGTDIRFTISSEDTTKYDADYNDLVLEVRKIGPIIDIPHRPYAVRIDNFQMMPDGVFETSFGQYYMGVRVKNIWGDDFPNDQLLDITQQSRSILASQGVQIIDSWTGSELDSLGQKMNGRRVIIGPLRQFESVTVFFKLDCSNAIARKHHVEFECLQPIIPDPHSPDRRVTKKVLVSRSYYDAITNELVAECPQGTLRMKPQKLLVDKNSLKRAIKRIERKDLQPPLTVDELKRVLEALEKGRRFDLCQIMRILKCYCDCGSVDKGGLGRSGKYDISNFLFWPLEFSYTIETPPYSGSYSPLPYDDPWWKLLLLLLALILYLVGTGEDLAYHSEDIGIGKLDRWDYGLDAAACLLNKHRSLPVDTPFHYLDAQSGEVSTVPLTKVDSDIAISGYILSNKDLEQLDKNNQLIGLKVFKSGARTGVTYGKIGKLTKKPFTRPDGRKFSKPQIEIVPDPSQPMTLSGQGDSGSLWITRDPIGNPKVRRIVALHHSGSGDGTWACASRIEDVMEALKIRFRS